MGTLLSDGFGIAACLRSCCLATDVFTEPFLKNGCLFWFHGSCFEHTCHNMKNSC
jgi:hypothetical protein